MSNFLPFTGSEIKVHDRWQIVFTYSETGWYLTLSIETKRYWQRQNNDNKFSCVKKIGITIYHHGNQGVCNDCYLNFMKVLPISREIVLTKKRHGHSIWAGKKQSYELQWMPNIPFQISCRCWWTLYWRLCYEQLGSLSWFLLSISFQRFWANTAC